MTLLWKFTLGAALPVDIDLREIPFPVYASLKLDGVRAGVQRGVLVSRNGRPIANLQAQKRFGLYKYEGVDGELTVGLPNGKDVFNRTIRVTQKRDADASDLRFNVFDFFARDSSYKTRLEGLTATFGDFKLQSIYVVRQTRITGPDQLAIYEQKALADGYEGVMLRRCAAGPYMEKRSTVREFNLVKLKRFDYGMAEITAVYPLEHNTNEERTSTGARSSKKGGIVADKRLMGSVSVEDVGGKFGFRLSLGSAELRSWPGWRSPDKWCGKKIRYKFFPTGNVKAPRFPTADFKELIG